jgi:hypothetical protein
MPVGGQWAVYNLGPSRAVGTVLYGLIGLAATAVLITWLAPETIPVPSARRWLIGHVPREPRSPLLLGSVGLFAVVSAVAAVVNARRWRVQRAVAALMRDPAFATLLPTTSTDTTAPVAHQIPPVTVRFDRPWPWQGAGRLQSVRRHINVVGLAPTNIVYLRVFANEARERNFVRGAWREFGYVRLLRSAAAVPPATLLRWHRNGALRTAFIRGGPQLDDALAGVAQEPLAPGPRRIDTIAGSSVLVYDRFGSFPEQSLLVHGTYWQQALDRLLSGADLVVLDLSGYRRRNRGTGYELQRLVDTVPVERVLLLADPWSNKRFLRRAIEQAWRRMAAGSPNAGTGHRSFVVGITDTVVTESIPGSPSAIRTQLKSSRRLTRWLLLRAQQRAESAAPIRLDGDGRPTGGHRAGGQPAHPTDRDADVGTGRSKLRRIGVLVGTVIAALAVFAVFAVLTVVGNGRLPVPAIFGSAGVPATVVPGNGYRMRAGPSALSRQVGTPLPAGTEVTVACLERRWARLVEPVRDAYVYAEGLRMSRTVPPC